MGYSRRQYDCGALTLALDLYDKVRVSSELPAHTSINGAEGAVAGVAIGDNGEHFYAVFIYKTERVWSVSEKYLVPTGSKDKMETFFDGTRIRVEVDPETGKGSIKGTT